MAIGPIDPIIQNIRNIVLRLDGAGKTDRELLERFVANRDAAAFEALVRRHGPMIWGVCERVLGNYHDSEDAFQATFLVLARKAASVAPADMVGNWLYGVAHITAVRAKTASAKRHRREKQRRNMPEPTSSDKGLSQETLRQLDQELTGLPDKFRTVIVLCDLEGRSRKQVAEQLKIPEGTLSSRLTRARKMLAKRLARHGLPLSGAAVATTLSQSASSGCVPAALIGVTVKAAIAVAAGEALTAVVSAKVAVLTTGVVKTMLITKLKTLTAVVLVLSAIGVGGGMLTRQMAAEQQNGEQKEIAKSPRAVDASKDDEAQKASAQDALVDRKEGPRMDRLGDPLPAGAITRLGTVRFNHGSHVDSFHFTPDAKTIVSFGGGSLCLWEAATGKERARYATKVGFNASSLLLPDGKTLLILARSNDTLHVWDLEQGKESRKLQLPAHRGIVSAEQNQAISPDGRMCATHTDHHVQVWDAATGKELFKLPAAGGAIRAIAFAGNKWLVSADRKQMIDVWDARTGAHVRKFEHGGPVEVIAASPDGRLLATIEHYTYAIKKLLAKDVVHVWDLTTGARKHALVAPPQSYFMDVQFSADSALVLAYSVGRNVSRMTFWEAESGKQIRELPTGGASSLSPDGRYLVAGHAKFGLWDLKTGRSLPDEDTRHASAANIHLSSSGDRVLTLGYDSFGTWDVATGKPLRTVEVPPYHRMPPYRCCSPDGKYVVSFQAAQGNEVDLLLWEVASGKLLHTLSPSVPGRFGQYSTAFTQDSSQLVTCEWMPDYENFFRFWDVRSGKEVRQFKEAKSRLGRPIFSADGRSLYLVGRPVVAYDAATGAELFSWRVQPPPSSVRTETKGVREDENDGASWRSLAIAPDGSVAAGVLSAQVGSHERVKDRLAICDARTGKVWSRWSDSGINGRDMEQVIFSEDSRLLATADRADVHVWEVATASKVNTFRGHRDEICALSFSSGGRRLASAADDTTVLVWDLPLALNDGPGKQPQQALGGWWSDLLGADARRAYQAIFALAQAPAISVPFLRKQLQPAPMTEVQEIRQCVADLGSGEFPVRAKATARLKALGPAAAKFLAQKLQEKLPLETRRRVEELVNSPESRASAGETLRTLRALTALEHMCTLDAHRLFQELASGAPGAWLTREADAARRRIASRQTGK